VNEPRTGESNRPAVVEAMARHVGRLAAQCGIAMADEGEPEPIGDHFWYDETHEWPEAARAGSEQAAELLATC
jgi:hypothetical protein